MIHSMVNSGTPIHFKSGALHNMVFVSAAVAANKHFRQVLKLLFIHGYCTLALFQLLVV